MTQCIPQIFLTKHKKAETNDYFSDSNSEYTSDTESDNYEDYGSDYESDTETGNHDIINFVIP